MRCLSSAGIAAAATAGVLDGHLAECLACRRDYEVQREMRALLQRMPAPSMTVSRRREMAAEIAARVERAPARRSRGWMPVAAVAAAVVAAAAGVVAMEAREDRTSTRSGALAGARTPERLSTNGLIAGMGTDTGPFDMCAGPRWRSACARLRASGVAGTGTDTDTAARPLPSPRIDAGHGAQLSHRIGAERDVLTLEDGNVAVDTRGGRDVDVQVGESVVRLEDASVRIKARKRAIVSVQIVVGSARVIAATGDAQRDEMTLPEPPRERRALDAFRDGWIALRAGHNREAMALFDQATDPVVAEEAAYWAAIAARRAGDEALAAARLEAFVRRYPTSPYVARIRGAVR